METESVGLETVMAGQTNWLLDLLATIPTPIWVVVLGAIGWFGKTAFDAWNNARLPFKQDRDRYQAVLNSIDPSDLYSFRDPDFSCVFKRRLDGVDEAAHRLTEIHLPGYMNRKLGKQEAALRTSMNTLADHLALKFFPCHGNQEAFTMYWGTFDEWDHEDQRRASEIQGEISARLNDAIEAYEAYRDYGNRLFADRLVKEKSGG
tara:strand:- start:3377 stop:3991 length:615 start_codon:yes stop_codon:yes gene_type:complete